MNDPRGPSMRPGSTSPTAVPTHPGTGPPVSGLSPAWVFLPVLGAALAHAPVLRWDIAPALKRPISPRLFGQNKTWRGALVMTGGTVAAAVELHRMEWYRARLPAPVAEADPALVGVLLGLGSWTGELPNSFLKRRLGIPPGQRRSSPLGVAIAVFDQADWVPVACLLLRPIWRMRLADASIGFVIVAAAHLPINLIGYAIGARNTPL